MQLKIFIGFDALDAQRMLKQWREQHPQVRILSKKTAPPQAGLGHFEGRHVHQIVVEYDGDSAE